MGSKTTLTVITGRSPLLYSQNSESTTRKIKYIISNLKMTSKPQFLQTITTNTKKKTTNKNRPSTKVIKNPTYMFLSSHFTSIQSINEIITRLIQLFQRSLQLSGELSAAVLAQSATGIGRSNVAHITLL